MTVEADGTNGESASAEAPDDTPGDMTYTLIGADAKPYESSTPGTLGGHRRNKVYGRLDCAGALRWIAKGHYVKQRVFFADEATAIAAGYRPCARCMPAEYRAWKHGRDSPCAKIDRACAASERSSTRPAPPRPTPGGG